MTQHTQGPWKAKRPQEDEAWMKDLPEVQKQRWLKEPYESINSVATGEFIVWWDPDQTVHEANARLMAASPELLEALEELTIVATYISDGYDESHDGHEGPWDYERLDKAIESARAAMAKAKGEV